jgi:serine O-acetyltransferase
MNCPLVAVAGPFPGRTSGPRWRSPGPDTRCSVDSESGRADTREAVPGGGEAAASGSLPAGISEDSDLKRHPLSDRLREITQRVVDTYGADSIVAHNIDPDLRLPSREAARRILEMLFAVFYPGYHGVQHLTQENVAFHVGAILDDAAEELSEQAYQAFFFDCRGREEGCDCAARSEQVVEKFFAGLPTLRRRLAFDVQAAYDGDPAASNLAEIVFAYPGLRAITVYRVAHELHALGVPLLPRIMTEWAHSETGIDIHPGARIGKSFFIDHGTGVVIGETTDIGENVKIYQGVTLGALSFPKDERGKIIRGAKRHPTIEDGVVIYAGATILGGNTVIGQGAVIGGNTWVIDSVAPFTKVLNETRTVRIDSNGNKA